MILSNNKIVLWTIISHAFIIIGIGHGGANWFLLEIAYLWDLIAGSYDLFEGKLVSISVLLCFIGQSLLMLSIISKKVKRKKVFHISGLVLLLVSFFLFAVSIERNSSAQVLYLSTAPFILLVISTFLFYPLLKLWKKLFDKI